MSSAQIFLDHQPLLHRMAYNMVGSWKDAEDLVQDTFEKWLKVDHDKIKNIKAYLIQTLKNICINFLNSIKRNREIHFGNPFEALKNRYEEMDFQKFDFDYNVSQGVAELLQKLTLPEFSMFILKEGFEMDYPELSDIFEKKLDHCRQLISRAKKKIEDTQIRFPLNKQRKNQLAEELSNVYANGNLNNLILLLKKENKVG